jgi:hypothetical protein
VDSTVVDDNDEREGTDLGVGDSDEERDCTDLVVDDDEREDTDLVMDKVEQGENCPVASLNFYYDLPSYQI